MLLMCTDQVLVAAWTTDNRWRTTAWYGRPLMALFARVAKLGSGAYGARQARVRPSVLQCVLARQRNSGYKAEQIKYRGTRPLQFPPLALIHTSLKKRGRAQHLHLTHTVRQAWWYRATLFLSHPWGRALGQPVRQASALLRKGDTCHLVKKERSKRKRPSKVT